MDAIEFLKENKEITDYKIVDDHKISYELFFVKDKLETVRTTDATKTIVTIYVEHDNFKGDANFTLSASITVDEIRNKIKEAVLTASKINNENYRLPQNETCSEEQNTNFKNVSVEELASKIEHIVRAHSAFDDGGINALEIFINKHEISVRNSCGVDKKEIKYDAMIEAIPTWNCAGESVELYQQIHFNCLNEDNLAKQISDKMIEVQARSKAMKPTEKLSCPVVFRSEELATIFSEYVHNLNYSSIYNKQSVVKIGDSVQESDDCDKITLSMVARIDGSVNSAFFDGDGCALKDATLIKEGKAVGSFGSSRFAQYLKAEPTGNLSCMKVKGGSLNSIEFVDEQVLEVVSMSGLQVDLYNDYIGGEIRLAYLREGDKMTPITGISISGKLSKVINSLKLSKECTVFENYYGPIFGLTSNFEIL